MRQLAEQFRHLMNHASLYEVMLNHGRAMSIEPLAYSEARQIAELTRRAGFSNVNAFRIKECYMNAQKLIAQHDSMKDGDKIEYCEGYVAWDDGPIAADHAWITINGKVVDVTLRAADKQRKNSYYGIAISLKLLLRHQLKTRYYSPVFEGPFQLQVFPGLDKCMHTVRT